MDGDLQFVAIKSKVNIVIKNERDFLFAIYTIANSVAE